MNSTRSACVMSVHTLVLAPSSDEVQHGRRGAALGHCSPETAHRKQVITMHVVLFTGVAPSNNTKTFKPCHYLLKLPLMTVNDTSVAMSAFCPINSIHVLRRYAQPQ